MSGNLDAEGIPDLETPLNDDEGMIAPGDHPIAADEFGVTALEARAQEPISERVTRELPDVSDPVDETAATGRLVEPGSEDVDTIDDEKDVVATFVGDDDEGALSAEESAMHITDSP